MNLQKAEERLAVEMRYLSTVVHTGNRTAIALAQTHVKYWESEVARLRLIDEGGWKGARSK